MEKQLDSILLIEDNKLTNMLNTKFLNKIEAAKHIHSVEDGSQALDYLMNEGEFSNNGGNYPYPDLILLDLNMPVMDGWEFLEVYEQMDKYEPDKGKVIVLTTSPDPHDEERARGINSVMDYCQKPLSKNDLDDIISTYFNV